jgi:hypothetical protein
VSLGIAFEEQCLVMFVMVFEGDFRSGLGEITLEMFDEGKLVQELFVRCKLSYNLVGPVILHHCDTLLQSSAVSKHQTILSIFDKTPVIGESTFVAPGASVIGDIQIGEKSSVWYGCVLRGKFVFILCSLFTYSRVKLVWFSARLSSCLEVRILILSISIF